MHKCMTEMETIDWMVFILQVIGEQFYFSFTDDLLKCSIFFSIFTLISVLVI